LDYNVNQPTSNLSGNLPDNSSGTLYIVATPIGNLGDMSQRAIETLKNVDLIAAEDTRHSRTLLQQFAITTSLTALHEHNERDACEDLLKKIQTGQSIAVISDAGTPLISDPGYYIVRRAHQLGLPVVPIPGASTLTAALCAAGLATNSVHFEGFLSSKSTQRIARLKELANSSDTLVFFEAPHRIIDTLSDMKEYFGGSREAVFMRELTKMFETIKAGSLDFVQEFVSADSNQRKGEIAIVVEGVKAKQAENTVNTESERILKLLLKEFPTKKAAAITAEITGLRKNQLYQHALMLSDRI